MSRRHRFAVWVWLLVLAAVLALIAHAPEPAEPVWTPATAPGTEATPYQGEKP